MDNGPDAPQGGASQPDWGDMKGKLTAAKGADRMILIAGLVFVVASFLPWYGLRVLNFGANVSGWSSGGLAVISILLAIAATAFAAVRVLGVNLSLGNVKDGVVYLVTGVGAFAFAVLRFLTATRFSKYGLYLAIIAGGFLAFGAWQKFNSSK